MLHKLSRVEHTAAHRPFLFHASYYCRITAVANHESLENDYDNSMHSVSRGVHSSFNLWKISITHGQLMGTLVSLELAPLEHAYPASHSQTHTLSRPHINGRITKRNGNKNCTSYRQLVVSCASNFARHYCPGQRTARLTVVMDSMNHS